MSDGTLILIYHRITEAGGGKTNLHCLSRRTFHEQMNYLKQSSRPVVSAREMVNAGDDIPGVRVALTFDDGTESDIESAYELRALGYSALFFIATDYLGKAGYLSRRLLADLHGLGMRIGSHSHQHVHLAPLADRDVEKELRRSKEILEDMVGTAITDLSFPGGSYSQRVLTIARRVGFRNFFTSDWGVNRRRHFARRVYRRTAVLNYFDIDQFEALLALRNYRARQVAFQTKELAKRIIGVDRYSNIRRMLLDRVLQRKE